ncbi:hypothetical protein BDW59DRAFT_161302 [Aspergillus cavernicola]|uniref:F-box domain-containing protein n=1 Tax=Aspergillus cavernicola TaxID=176166 RepID=A0ABR4IDU7_9EURO
MRLKQQSIQSNSSHPIHLNPEKKNASPRVHDSGLIDLPTELLSQILTENDSENKGILNLSRTSKFLRTLCIPTLFCSVTFPCSKHGLQNLHKFIESEYRKHVVHFTYSMPLFFKPEVLDLDHFMDVMMTPESITDIENEDGPGSASGCIKDLHDIYCTHYSETKEIIKNGIGMDEWTTEIKTYEHHIPILEQAIANAKTSGRHIQSLRLVGIKLPNGKYWTKPKTPTRGNLQRMVTDTDCV